MYLMFSHQHNVYWNSVYMLLHAAAQSFLDNDHVQLRLGGPSPDWELPQRLPLYSQDSINILSFIMWAQSLAIGQVKSPLI